MAVKISNGMLNAYMSGLGKGNGKKKVKCECPGCGLTVPCYPGRYPKKCPKCYTPLIVGFGSFIRGTVDKDKDMDGLPDTPSGNGGGTNGEPGNGNGSSGGGGSGNGSSGGDSGSGGTTTGGGGMSESLETKLEDALVVSDLIDLVLEGHDPEEIAEQTLVRLSSPGTFIQGADNLQVAQERLKRQGDTRAWIEQVFPNYAPRDGVRPNATENS